MCSGRTATIVLCGVLCLAGPATAQTYSFSHLAGNPGGFGVADGAGAAARFSWPRGIAVDQAGTIYVSDFTEHTIRTITPAGVVTTLAGAPGQRGHADGQGSAARFFQPTGIAIDAARNLYVADAHVIRKVTPAGVVTTVAGLYEAAPETVDGTGSAARFTSPTGIAVSPDGTLLIVDSVAAVVRHMTTDGVVTTVAGSAGDLASVDGVGNQARFIAPVSVEVGPDGTAYIVDPVAKVVRRMTPDRSVTTLAGWVGDEGTIDGTGPAARFRGPRDVVYGPGGVLVVTDGYTLRTVTQDGVVTTIAGSPLLAGAGDGPAPDARFRSPQGIARSASGELFVTDAFNNTVRKIDTSWTVSTLAGAAPLPKGYQDGLGAEARFGDLDAVVVMRDGDMIVADMTRSALRRITPAGQVTTWAGDPFSPGWVDGDISVARFGNIFSLALAPDGTLYVYEMQRLRAVSPAGVVTTIAGDGDAGWADGQGSAARFAAAPGNSIAVGPDGTIYVADTGNNVIRKVTPSGSVTTWAGAPSMPGHADGTGSAARFNAPQGIVVSPSGIAYVSDLGNHVVRAITPDGVVSTLAGAVGVEGFADGRGGQALFVGPQAAAIDGNGNVLVADGSAVRRITPTGLVTTIVGDQLKAGSEDGIGTAARFWGALALTVSSSGNLVIADAGNFAIRVGVPTRFLAEGASTATFDTRIALFNPGALGAYATVTFQRAGQAPVTTVKPVPAGWRVTIDPAAIPGTSPAEFSTTVDAPQPLVVDRTVSWSGANAYGAHAETAVRAPSLTWYLAEGATHSGMQLFYLLQNPNAIASQVRVRYLRPSGGPLEKTYTLSPQSRTNIWVNVEEFAGLGTALSSTDVSAAFEVLNDQPIIVERALYLDVPGQFFGAGHESMGVTAPARQWFLAEGATGPFFDLFVLVANPGNSEAQVEAMFLLPGGATVVKPYTIAANSRFNIWVDREDARLADTAVSTTIRSVNDVPVIVERALWWPEGGWYEAHNTPGATATGTRWAVADGEVDAARGLETYLLIANTSAFAADVKVTLHFEDGATAAQTYNGIAPRSRYNVAVAAQFAQAAGKRFGAVIESLGTTPAQIVVERAMYWNAAGQMWAAGTSALATRLP